MSEEEYLDGVQWHYNVTFEHFQFLKTNKFNILILDSIGNLIAHKLRV